MYLIGKRSHKKFIVDFIECQSITTSTGGTAIPLTDRYIESGALEKEFSKLAERIPTDKKDFHTYVDFVTFETYDEAMLYFKLEYEGVLFKNE